MDEKTGQHEAVADIAIFDIIESFISGEIGNHFVIDWFRVLKLPVHGHPQNLSAVMLYTSAWFYLVNYNRRDGIECVIFLHVGAVNIDPTPLSCFISFPVGMDVDIGYTSGIVFLFKTAVLKGDVL